MAIVSDFTAILSGGSLHARGVTGTPAFVSYSFSEQVPDYVRTYFGAGHPGLATFRPMTEQEKAVARASLKAWADACGITLFEVESGKGELNFGVYDTALLRGRPNSGFAFLANGPNLPAIASDIFLNRKFLESLADVGDAAHLMLHEIGHALGFKHPHDGETTLSKDLDTIVNTQLSYNSPSSDKLGSLDVLAAVHLYGAADTDGKQIASWSFDQATFTLTQAGSAAAETIRGIGGKDIIRAGDGDDTIYGVTGDDTVHGEGGNDTIHLRDGTVVADGGDGNDRIFFSGGNGTLLGGAGDDLIGFISIGEDLRAVKLHADGGSGSGDTIWLNFRPPADESKGITFSFDESIAAAGWTIVNFERTQLDGSDRADEISGGALDDGIFGRSGNDNLKGLGGRDFIFGHAGNDELDGGDGDDWLEGGDGDDLLIGGAGRDMMIGGLGSDRYVVDMADETVTEKAGEGDADVIFTALSQYSLPANVELLVGLGSTGQQLRGNGSANGISGGSGNDLIDLRDGGNDVVLAGAGNDILFYGGAFTAEDDNDGGNGTDTIVLQGNYADLTLGTKSLTGVEGVSIQSGTITRWGQSGTNSYDYHLKTIEANVAAGQQLRVNAQSLVAGEDFTFNGSAETDGGRFLVYAGYGVDVLTGGTGNDVFFFEAGRIGAGDKVNGGGGTDAVVISGKEPSVTGAATFEIASGTFTSIEALSFNGRFASDPNALPSYKVVLKDGNIAADGRLVVNGSSLGASQSLSFDASAVTSGKLIIFGGAGADTLTGGASDDVLFAGAGADTLTGGAGSDIFQFRSLLDSTVSASDRIIDFAPRSDKIDLSMIDASSGLDGDQAFASIGNRAFSKTAGELRYEFDAAAGLWRVEGDVNGDGTADFLINLTVTGPSPLSDTSFIF